MRNCRWETVPSWEARTKKLADLVRPYSDVIEFGAGNKSLQKYLVDCIYTPSDLYDRGDTLVIDLNGELPGLRPYDVAVFSGVLEYVEDVPRLVNHLHNYVDEIVCSYATYDKNAKNRKGAGWVNHYTFDEVLWLFYSSGFYCVKLRKWQFQHLFRFIKKTDQKFIHLFSRSHDVRYSRTG